MFDSRNTASEPLPQLTRAELATNAELLREITATALALAAIVAQANATRRTLRMLRARLATRPAARAEQFPLPAVDLCATASADPTVLVDATLSLHVLVRRPLGAALWTRVPAAPHMPDAEGTWNVAMNATDPGDELRWYTRGELKRAYVNPDYTFGAPTPPKRATRSKPKPKAKAKPKPKRKTARR